MAVCVHNILIPYSFRLLFQLLVSNISVILFKKLNFCLMFSEKPFVELRSKAEEKAKMYYLSCMDSNETIEALGAEPMLNLLRKVGGWNISAVGGKSFNVSAWDLQNTVQILQNRYNMGGLFSWAVGEDDRNSSRHVIQVRI